MATEFSKTQIIIYILIVFIFGTLLGSGALWQWPLQEKAHKLETSKHIATLRQDATKLFIDVVELYSQYVPIDSKYRSMQYSLANQYTKEKNLEFLELNKKLIRLKAKLNFLKTSYNDIEKEMAILEKRKSRPLPDFAPPTPVVNLR